MDAIICFIMGLNKEAFKNCPREVRRAYYNTVFAWFAVSLMGAFTGYDIAHNFTSETSFLIAASTIGCFFVGFVDYQFISTRKSGALAALFRFIFALVVIAIAAVSALGLLFSNDIDNQLEKIQSQKIAALDSTYDARIDTLYSDVRREEAEVEEYHQTVCVPEAKRGFAGKIYRKKHAYCIKRRKEIAAQRKPLEAKEAKLHKAYLKKREQLSNYKAGISKRYTTLYEMVSEDNVKLVLAIAFFAILLLFDLQALVSKLSIPKKNEYTKWVKNLNEDNKGKRELKRRIDHNENIMVRAVEGFESVLANNNLITHLKKFTKKHTNLRPMAKSMISELESSREEVISGLKGHDIYETLVTNEENLTDTEPIDTANSKAPISKYNLFYMTQPMKKIADQLWREANGNGSKYCELVFWWMNSNIEYNDKHTHEFYMTAREVFNSKMGVCGESALLYGAFMKYKNQAWTYCHVDVDRKGENVNHACNLIKTNGREILVDIAYSSYGISHQNWEKVDEDVLIKNMISWNR